MEPESFLVERLPSGNQTAKRLEKLLRVGDVQLLSDSPSETTVYEASRLWRMRQAGQLSRGRTLEGAEGLISHLSHLTPQKKLVQYVLKGEKYGGCVFFEKTSRIFVGIILVKREEKIERANAA